MKNNGQPNPFPLKYVAQKTGLSTQLIRVWEKRYQAITPSRLDNNHRAYSEDDIRKLFLLKQIVEEGLSIGKIAHLSIDELEKLYSKSSNPSLYQNQATELNQNDIEQAFQYIQNMEPQKLDQLLTRASLENPPLTVIENLVVPLMYKIGNEWEAGDITISHEHMTSSVVRYFLQSINKAYHNPDHAPKIVIATPDEHHHELGALITAAIASSKGWSVIYLGANTPISDIAHTALNYYAKAVALSLTYPKDYEINKNIIKNMRLYLPKEIPLFVGGKAIEEWQGVFNDRGVTEVNNIHDFRKRLENLKTRKTHDSNATRL